MAKIRPFYQSNYIKVITGVRRSGKSVLLKQIKSEIIAMGVKIDHIISIDLEGISGSGITTRKKLEKKISKLVKGKDKYFIFIDEVQHIKRFEEAIASIRVSFNCSLFVTGSNSKLLHGKLQDRLTGRAKEFEIYPFTYRESLEFKKANGMGAEDKGDDFKNYLAWGGMPQRYEEVDDNGIIDYLSSLYESILEKDVFGNHKRINKESFKLISRYVMGHSGKLFSALSLARYFKGGVSETELKSSAMTINRYVEYMKECYFLVELLPYCLQGKEALKGTRKLYSIDPGFVTALGTNDSLDYSFSLEGAILLELLYRGYKVSYGKLRVGEVDFVAEKGKKKCLIQVAYRINTEQAFEREYGAFKSIRDASPKYVISLDDKDTSHDGITHLNAIDFLSGEADVSVS